MKTELNSKEYVSFARRFVKELVEDMDIEELRSIVTDRIHEEIQEGENDFGQRGAFEEMWGWSEDIFNIVAKDYDLTFDEDDLIEEVTTACGWCIKSIDYDIQLK